MKWSEISVSKDGTHHVVNGTPLYSERFEKVLKFHEPGLAPVLQGGLAWHIRADGSAAYQTRFQRTFGFYGGLAAVVSDDGWYHINLEGIPAYSERYAWCGNFQDGLCTVRTGEGRYFHIKADGAKAYEASWKYAGDFRDGIAVVQGDDGLSTHIDHQGTPIHGVWFHDLDIFHKGFARARDVAGWTHVDMTGRPLYERRFAAVEPFYNGQARVARFDGGFEVISETNCKGLEVRPAPGKYGRMLEHLEKTRSIEWVVPPSNARWLEEIAEDVPVAILLRHSVRGDISAGDAGYGVPLTEIGGQLARDLGAMLGNRLKSIHSSPFIRCIQTGKWLKDGAGVDVEIREDRLLGDPGVYVINGGLASAFSREVGHVGVMHQLVTGDAAGRGLADADSAATFLVNHMLTEMAGQPGIHVFVTHDSLVTATAARMLDAPLSQKDWPWYLEGAFFWSQKGQLETAYKGYHGARPLTDLVIVTPESVVGYARREIAAVLGHDVGARFFFAGGAFKTLLTGRPAKDLDIWAATARDREILVGTLLDRGAVVLERGCFGDRFGLGGRVVDIPDKIWPDTLESKLAGFDIGLSAIGVEYTPYDQWRAFISPLASESIARKQILIIKPLANWKYALTSLERLRRYARELKYGIRPEDEDEIWRVFDSQSPEMKIGMFERFCRTTQGGFGVKEEAECRLR